MQISRRRAPTRCPELDRDGGRRSVPVVCIFRSINGPQAPRDGTVNAALGALYVGVRRRWSTPQHSEPIGTSHDRSPGVKLLAVKVLGDGSPSCASVPSKRSPTLRVSTSTASPAHRREAGTIVGLLDPKERRHRALLARTRGPDAPARTRGLDVDSGTRKAKGLQA